MTEKNSTANHRPARSARHLGTGGPNRDRLDRAQHAELAAYSVTKLFVHRLMGIPGTLIAEATAPAPSDLKKKILGWNYWWQAHLLDAMVDAGFRALEAQRDSDAKHWLDDGRRLLRGIRWHNAGTYVNSFYDDMAWLTLAAQRLNDLSLAVEGHGCDAAQEVGRTLYPQLRRAITDDLDGGAFWSKAEDFKNTPATAPIALALARAGDHEAAASLLGWLKDKLFSEERGYLDGIKMSVDRDGGISTTVEEKVHPYNQGVPIGAHLETRGADIAHVEQIIDLVDRTQTVEVEVEGVNVRLLDTRGSGDGGLFTGILARYLTAAAQDTRISPTARATARDLVIATAELLWAGRREFDPDLPLNEPGVDVTEIRGQAVAVFSPDATRHSSETLGAGARIELSTQIQAWTIMEAAYRLS